VGLVGREVGRAGRRACSERTISCWVARVRSLAIPGLVGGACSEGTNACWVARVQSLAIPGFVGEAGGEKLLFGRRECGASRSRACSEGLGRRVLGSGEGEGAGGVGWVGACGGVEDDDWESGGEDFAPCGEAGAEAVLVFGEGGVAGFEGGGVE